jgi:hypothetical protein
MILYTLRGASPDAPRTGWSIASSSPSIPRLGRASDECSARTRGCSHALCAASGPCAVARSTTHRNGRRALLAYRNDDPSLSLSKARRSPSSHHGRCHGKCDSPDGGGPTPDRSRSPRSVPTRRVFVRAFRRPFGAMTCWKRYPAMRSEWLDVGFSVLRLLGRAAKCSKTLAEMGGPGRDRTRDPGIMSPLL